MTILRDVARGLTKMFLADAAMTAALLAVVAAAAGLIHLAGVPPLVGGGALLAGCLVVLAVSLRSAANRARK